MMIFVDINLWWLMGLFLYLDVYILWVLFRLALGLGISWKLFDDFEHSHVVPKRLFHHTIQFVWGPSVQTPPNMWTPLFHHTIRMRLKTSVHTPPNMWWKRGQENHITVTQGLWTFSLFHKYVLYWRNNWFLSRLGAHRPAHLHLVECLLNKWFRLAPCSC